MRKPEGITVTLYGRIKTGTDGFNRPEYAETQIQVSNVLIGEPSSEDIADELNTSGKHLAYTLAIPKGDTNDWIDKKVSFFGKDYRTFGEVTQGIEELIPLSWNKKVKVEIYE
mgnify:CR=1 FL=1